MLPMRLTFLGQANISSSTDLYPLNDVLVISIPAPLTRLIVATFDRFLGPVFDISLVMCFIKSRIDKMITCHSIHIALHFITFSFNTYLVSGPEPDILCTGRILFRKNEVSSKTDSDFACALRRV